MVGWAVVGWTVVADGDVGRWCHVEVGEVGFFALSAKDDGWLSHYCAHLLSFEKNMGSVV